MRRAEAQEGFPRLSLLAVCVQDLPASLKRCFFNFLTPQSPQLTAHDRTWWGGVPAEPLPAPALRARTAPAFVLLSPPTPLLAHWTLVRAPAPHCWGPLAGRVPSHLVSLGWSSRRAGDNLLVFQKLLKFCEPQSRGSALPDLRLPCSRRHRRGRNASKALSLPRAAPQPHLAIGARWAFASRNSSQSPAGPASL